ncbi:MAG: hypothetical protein HWE27_03170 [Gammaproteobacteria bacterium]|nr:hypothetical protein [Gammaproteobacteria bacterium]
MRSLFNKQLILSSLVFFISVSLSANEKDKSSTQSAKTAATQQSPQPSLHPKLELFRPFINQTYRGEFASSTPDKPVIDVSKWERHLNGNAIRITHSLNEGSYGGETLIFYDKPNDKIRYFYFTTEGFFTEAEVTFDGSTMISHEKVTGNQNGITEVKAKAWLTPEGIMQTQSEYLQNGKWVPGHSATYKPAPDAKVIFK